MACIKIRDKTIPVQPHQSLLEAVEQAGFKPEFQCRNGFCGACKARLKKGTAHYIIPPLAYCDEDEVLMCCACLKPDEVIELELTQVNNPATS
ncbi:MAG: hypothetical protein CENE_00342 [Candidatus Celerinatantimonas neptuna]|nr:MAG: hypothetical protein CENE_00342 [Candidatus Celerinatantimonas neptuna]